jgi:hypothetical protein
VTARNKCGGQQGIFQRMRRRKRKKNEYVSFKTIVWAQPLIGRNAELG